MPTIRVELFEGRTADQKRALAKALTEACVQAIGATPGSVDILFYELPTRHWATGGVLWSDAPPASPAPPPPAPAPAPMPVAGAPMAKDDVPKTPLAD